MFGQIFTVSKYSPNTPKQFVSIVKKRIYYLSYERFPFDSIIFFCAINNALEQEIKLTLKTPQTWHQKYFIHIYTYIVHNIKFNNSIKT